MATIYEFTTSLRGGNFARKYNYDVSFTPPGGAINRELLMRCETFGFPGQNIATTIDDIRVGPAREHAMGVTYAPITATFLSTKDMTEKIMFTDWHYRMIDAGPAGFGSEPPTFRVGYYKDYVTDILVRQFDDGGKNTYSVKLIDAFPKTIVQQDLALADGEFHRLSVEFVFYRWVEIDTTSKQARPKDKDSVSDGGILISAVHGEVASHVQGAVQANNLPPSLQSGGGPS